MAPFPPGKRYCVGHGPAVYQGPPSAMKKDTVVRNTIVLPCCILLLNLCVGLVSYKAKVLDDPLLRTAAIMAMVLFGGSLVGLVMSPAIAVVVGSLHRATRQRWGGLGEAAFLLLLGALVFWLYYRMYILGPEYLLPPGWRNPRH
jgi:hypothetical protein